MRSLTIALLIPVLNLVQAVPCHENKDCESCAGHEGDFKEFCRWCVDTQSCGGPLSCPVGLYASRESFNCPKKHSEEHGLRYTDELGRSLYAVAIAARNDYIYACLANSRPDISNIKHFIVDCDDLKNTCLAFVAVSREAKAIYVSFRGSSIGQQFSNILSSGLSAQLGTWEKFVTEEAGVIPYMSAAFYRLFVEGGPKAEMIRLHNEYPEYRMWITGHSLGGSLASMTAFYLAHHNIVPREKIHLVTFAEPRTGNVAYAKSIEELISFRYRVVKRNDFVTNLPMTFDPNNLVLLPPQMERQARFYRYLVHYDNEMHKGDDFKICDLSDDHECRFLPNTNNYIDHLTYFGFSQDEYSAQNCSRSLLF